MRMPRTQLPVPARVEVMRSARSRNPVRPPPTAGSYGVAVSYERGTPVGRVVFAPPPRCAVIPSALQETFVEIPLALPREHFECSATPDLHQRSHGSGDLPVQICRILAKRPTHLTYRKVYVRLPGKGNSNAHGARPVHLIITMITWIRTSRLSIKNSLFDLGGRVIQAKVSRPAPTLKNLRIISHTPSTFPDKLSGGNSNRPR